jgi:excisionase family DNA binding protein
MNIELSTPERVTELSAGPRLGRSVSLDQAATLLGVSRRTIYNRIREGRLQTVRTLGGSQRVLVDSVLETPGACAEFTKLSAASR